MNPAGLFNEDGLICVPDYGAVMENTLLPELEKHQENRTVSGLGGIPLFCSLFRAEQPVVGTVVIIHGFTENAFKYSEIIYSLLMNHFDVIAYDQRGHGRSWRAQGVTEPALTHVDHFSDYVEDLRAVCEALAPEFPRPWMCFSHSMGGAVTALYLEKYPDTFSAAAMCAPMIAPVTVGLPQGLVGSITRVICLTGGGKRAPFFMKPHVMDDFNTSHSTDRARFDWYNAKRVACREFHNDIPTYGWISEASSVTRKILRPGAPESVACPVLLSTAELDKAVRPVPQEEFITRVPKGTHILVKEARHEIFRSADKVLFPWWHQNLLFLKEAAE